MKNRISGCLVFWLAAAGLAFAQEGFPPQPPAFKSPEIAADGKIVLRIHAPQAKSVKLSSSDFPGANPFAPGEDLKKGENGVWEAVVGPFPGGSYRYAFNVDGLATLDPRNPATSESNMNAWSLLHAPGSKVSDMKDVPHGAVATVNYHSKSLDRPRRMHVYTPPGYEIGSDKYPVLYLLHGALDCDASWSSVGRAGIVLDNLIAAKEVVPMVVVMPMGHTGPFTFGPGGTSFQQQMEEFVKDFTNDVKPLAEKRYRLRGGRENTAIAGLSMGGAQTLDIAIANLAQYGYVGVFSSGVFGIAGGGPGGGPGAGGPSWEERNKNALANAKLKEGLRLVWFATGKDDFLLSTTQGTVKALESHGFKVKYEETDGGHTWIKWREHYLPAFAKQLFREGSPAATGAR
ncbi:MAG TPA: alpha/beta hydrolase-fold protein [Planctomycetia bacterium]|nr:alpha/beta hydrolase-fold protein [Planctomycetia bacterium]